MCELVLGHSHSALKSRQLTAHTTGNARAPARAASQDCSAWEPTAARSHFAVYILRPKRKPTSSTFVFSFVVVIVCCVVVVVADVATVDIGRENLSPLWH